MVSMCSLFTRSRNSAITLDAFESFRRGGRRGLKSVITRNGNEG